MRFTSIILFFFSFTFLGCSQNGKLLEGEETTVTEEKLRYYLYFPPNYSQTSEEGFGLLLFLHGGGESGEDLETVKRNGPPKVLRDGTEYPFLLLAPQNPHKRKWWNVYAINELLEKMVAEHNVDRDRIYLSGLSRGGSAAWDMAVQYPEKFAALTVVCGMAPAPYADWLDKRTAIWVFHGADDKVIPVQESDNMVRKLKELDYNVKYTRYEGVGHNSWIQAYKTPGLYDWMAEQSRIK